jgi:hypothetical protein
MAELTSLIKKLERLSNSLSPDPTPSEPVVQARDEVDRKKVEVQNRLLSLATAMDERDELLRTSGGKRGGDVISKGNAVRMQMAGAKDALQSLKDVSAKRVPPAAPSHCSPPPHFLPPPPSPLRSGRAAPMMESSSSSSSLRSSSSARTAVPRASARASSAPPTVAHPRADVRPPPPCCLGRSGDFAAPRVARRRARPAPLRQRAGAGPQDCTPPPQPHSALPHPPAVDAPSPPSWPR